MYRGPEIDRYTDVEVLPRVDLNMSRGATVRNENSNRNVVSEFRFFFLLLVIIAITSYALFPDGNLYSSIRRVFGKRAHNV